MNERIQKLYVETTGKDWVYDFDPDYAEKFAELIIWECANICFSEADGHRIAFGEHCGIVIKQHFGVEE